MRTEICATLIKNGKEATRWNGERWFLGWQWNG